MDEPNTLSLRLHAAELAVCRLPADAPVPDVLGTPAGPLVSVTRTGDELSLVLPAEHAPDGATVERGWRALSVDGPLDFGLTGVLARLAAPLSEADVPIFVVSTYDTDWLLVKATDLDRAVATLRDAGHRVTAG